MKGPHQRLSDATTKVAAKSADSATERTSAGRSSCINAKRQPAANIMSTQSTNMPTRHGRWLPVARVYLCVTPGLVAASTLWLCFHFFQSLHQANHLGPTIIAVVTTTTMAVINVVECWSTLDRFTTPNSTGPTPPAQAHTRIGTQS